MPMGLSLNPEDWGLITVQIEVLKFRPFIMGPFRQIMFQCFYIIKTNTLVNWLVICDYVKYSGGVLDPPGTTQEAILFYLYATLALVYWKNNLRFIFKIQQKSEWPLLCMRLTINQIGRGSWFSQSVFPWRPPDRDFFPNADIFCSKIFRHFSRPVTPSHND